MVKFFFYFFLFFLILVEGKANGNIMNTLGDNIIWLCIQNRYYNVLAEIIVSAKLNIDSPLGLHNWSPLMRVIVQLTGEHQDKAFKFLLNNGADANYKNVTNSFIFLM